MTEKEKKIQKALGTYKAYYDIYIPEVNYVTGEVCYLTKVAVNILAKNAQEAIEIYHSSVHLYRNYEFIKAFESENVRYL